MMMELQGGKMYHYWNTVITYYHSAGRGSTKGTMCVHELCDKEIETFKVLYFWWSHVHAQNIRGPVNCVSWIPAAKDRLKLALAGNDGVVIVWELMDSVFPNLHDRNYLKEINYFHPGRRSFVGEGAQEFDVASITSIMATQSDVCSYDGKSVASDDDSASGSGNEKATPVNSRVRKVLVSQEDLRSGMSDLLDGIQDIISRLSAIGQIADTDNAMLSELTDSSKDAKEKLDSIEDSVEKFSVELKALEAEIKGKRTALESAEAAGTQVVQKSMETTEKLEMLLSKANAIVTQLKSQHYNLEATLVRNKNHLEQTLTSKLWKLEDSIKTMFRSMEESMNLKHRHLEQAITERLTNAEESMQAYLKAVEKENAERHTEVISRFDTIIKLLKKSGNFPMHPTSEA